MRLDGKVALVTGAARGIGAAAAIACAEAGADVVLNDIGAPTETEAAIRALGRQVLALPADVADNRAVEEMFAKAAATIGRVDVLVANAAYSERGPFWEQSLDQFRRTIDVTMMGPFYCLRAATRLMLRQGGGGSIVVTGSPHALEAVPECMAYNMAKAAIDQMVKTAATELIPHKIRVNVIHPGWTDTPGERRFYSEEEIRRLGALLPMGRLARPAEIARGIVFLACPDSEYINGTVLSIDGGLLLPYNRPF